MLAFPGCCSAARAEDGSGKDAEGFEGCGRLFPPGVFDGGRPGRGGMPPGVRCHSGCSAVLYRMLH